MQNLYPLIKHIHVGAVLASGGFFLLRGLWMMQESSLLTSKFAKVVPHIIDTVLLLAAIALLVHLGALPTWVQVKVAALFLYIFLGMVAFRPGKAYGVRVTSFFLALGVFAFIMSVAITKSPWGFLGRFF
ncbi:MAG TPA: SirB2 family protein [Moraxellaceae bacterium]|nr:SirB2 family protein [Moraxellaceae bacterium]